MKATLRPALVLFFTLTVICCVLYPFAITAIGQAAFAHQVQGSIVLSDHRPIGSELIGQAFTSSRYFWGRPSATSRMPNNAAASGASNLGPTSPVFLDGVKARISALKAADPDNANPVPVDLVTASASGLDPDISLAAASYQARRVARERQLDVQEVRRLIETHATSRLLGLFGEPRVNVLALNLALDRMHQ